MFGNKGFDNLSILCNACKLIWKSKFNFNVATITATFIFISGLKKFFGIVVSPFRQMVRVKNTTLALLKSICAIDIIEMTSGGSFISSNVFVRIVDIGKPTFALYVLQVLIGRNPSSVRFFVRFQSEVKHRHKKFPP